MLPQLTQFLAALISHLGYPGVILLMAVESACIPLPSEIILPFAGYLVFMGRFDLPAVALAGALGCNLGSAVAYGAGYWGGRPLMLRYGARFGLPAGEIARAEHWFSRFGEPTVFAARLLPVVRTFIALPAGVARMNGLRFHLYTFLGSLPWCWALAWGGYRLGANWGKIEPYFHRFNLIWTPLLLAALAGIGWRRLYASRRSQPEQA